MAEIVNLDPEFLVLLQELDVGVIRSGVTTKSESDDKPNGKNHKSSETAPRISLFYEKRSGDNSLRGLARFDHLPDVFLVDDFF